MSARGIALYVHVPFCASRCPYCDFVTAPATTRLRADYMDALVTEIAREGAALGRPRLRTVYVGGGTPSLLEPDEIARLRSAIGSAFEWRPREVSVEANPATLDRARLEAWRAFGVTRVSLGAQSLSPRGLRALGRTHQPADVAAAVEAVRSIGADVNVDLIYGWAGQTPGAWLADVDAVLALEPDHVSAYALELGSEPDGSVANWRGAGWPALARWRRAAVAAQADDRGLALLYVLAARRFGRAGLRHYEISNWARAGKESLHDLTYWRSGEWLGAGAGAHSHIGGVRSHRPAALSTYIAQIGAGAARVVDGTSDEIDTAALALRLDSGLDLRRYGRVAGPAAAAHVGSTLRALGRVRPRVIRSGERRARLTLRGRVVSNEVFLRLLRT